MDCRTAGLPLFAEQVESESSYAVVIDGGAWPVLVLCSDLCTAWKCVVWPTLAGVCPQRVQRVEVGWEVLY